jgi:hypothetical protein
MLAQPSQDHHEAVNRRRRIVVQYDAHEHVGIDLEQWLDYRFSYIDEPEQKLLRLDFIVPPRLCHPGENQVSIGIIDRVPYGYGAVIILEKVEVHLDYLLVQMVDADCCVASA